jgi:hypothetical protein
MIGICGFCRENHAREDKNRCQDIAQKLEAFGHDGSRSGRISDPYVPRGEHTAYKYAGPGDFSPEAQILVVLRHQTCSPP